MNLISMNFRSSWVTVYSNWEGLKLSAALKWKAVSRFLFLPGAGSNLGSTRNASIKWMISFTWGQMKALATKIDIPI